MGQKVNPVSLRLVLRKNWQSRWFADKKYSKYLVEDFKIRDLIYKNLPPVTVSRVEIVRREGEIEVNIFTSKPGVIIGRNGQGTVEIKNMLTKKVKGKIKVNIIEVRKPDLDASMVAQNVAYQIQRRVAYRRAAKQAIERAIQGGAEGVKVRVSGRLGGADIARSEEMSVGSIPLQTLRSEIDYAHFDSFTTYGVVGVKVWVYLGEKFAGEENANAKKS